MACLPILQDRAARHNNHQICRVFLHGTRNRGFASGKCGVIATPFRRTKVNHIADIVVAHLTHTHTHPCSNCTTSCDPTIETSFKYFGVNFIAQSYQPRRPVFTTRSRSSASKLSHLQSYVFSFAGLVSQPTHRMCGLLSDHATHTWFFA
jgi:hypothetical protein